MARQVSTDTLTWGKALWGAGTSLEKSKGATVCLWGRINENLFLRVSAQDRLLCHWSCLRSPRVRPLVLS